MWNIALLTLPRICEAVRSRLQYSISNSWKWMLHKHIRYSNRKYVRL